MGNTTFFIQNGEVAYHLPYIYSHTDPLGSLDWSNTQVLKLLVSKDREGNCFALASFFKILSERLHSNAILCTTPGHIFIRHADDKGTYYNIELASQSFPGTGSIQVYTYTTDQALKNNISLRELDQRQSVGLCLIYLAKAYEYITHTKTDDFALQCAELALQYDSLNLNAMLLKGEVMEGRLIEKNKAIPQLQSEIQFQDYQKLVVRLFDLGYREMPDEQKRMIIDRLRDPDKLMAIGVNGLQLLRKQKSFETRKATLSWGLFDEEMLTKPIEIYGRTAFNTITKKITQFNPSDTNTDYPIDQIVFAMSVDPLTAKYPNMSPYLAFGANPILFVDNDGRELTLGGPDVNKTREALISMLNSSDIKNRVTIDENNKVSFNTVGLSKSQMKDNTVVLLGNLVNAKEKYLFEVNTSAQGIDRDDKAPKDYKMLNNGNSEGPADMNYSITDRQDQASQEAKGVTTQDYLRSDMLPSAGFDGQATVSPNKNAIYEPNPLGNHEIKTIDTKTGKQHVGNYSVKPYGSVVFHTLQEVYNRTTKGQNMTDAHNNAIASEKALPASSPAKSIAPGHVQTDQK
jgi:hypothetical protein